MLHTPRVLHFLDPLLFWVLMWLGVDIVVFAAIDEVSLPFATMVFGLCFWGIRLLTEQFEATKVSHVLSPLMFVLSCTVFSIISTLPKKQKGAFGAWGWFPNEWHHTPYLHFNMWLSIWPYALVVITISAYLLIQHVKGNLKPLRWYNASLLIVFVFYCLVWNIDALRFLLFQILLIASLIAIVVRDPIIERRLAFGGHFCFFVLANYFSMVPFTLFLPEHPPFISQVYPFEGVDPVVEMAHLREAIVDESGVVYATWGPTCGILKIDPENQSVLAKETSLMRFWEKIPDSNQLLSVTWEPPGSLYNIDMDTLKFTQEEPLNRFGLIQPFLIRHHKGDYLVDSYEPPMMLRLSKDEEGELIETARLNLSEAGLSDTPSGTAYFMISPDAETVLWSGGLTGFPWQFRTYVLNPNNLEVTHILETPELALDMIWNTKHNEIVLASFFSDAVWRFDAETFEHKGDASCVAHPRGFLYDAERDWLFCASYFNGEIAVLQGSDYSEIFRFQLARRVQNAHFGRSNDEIILPTTEGIFMLDLNRLEQDLQRQ